MVLDVVVEVEKNLAEEDRAAGLTGLHREAVRIPHQSRSSRPETMTAAEAVVVATAPLAGKKRMTTTTIAKEGI